MFHFNVLFFKKDQLCTVTMEIASFGSATGHAGSRTHNSCKVSWGPGIRWTLYYHLQAHFFYFVSLKKKHILSGCFDL